MIVGIHNSDDAGVLRLTDELALIQTVDFFTPIVDDPEIFGRIAATNSLSDVYAMGGRAVCAMNVVGFPINKLPIDLLKGCLKGGQEKLKEADVSLAGGHSIDNPEFFFGLSVSGLVHPDKILLNTGARDGDILVLTKPLGTGVITTALKGGMAESSAVEKIIISMEELNKSAAECLDGLDVHACTDVTGFGLIGHAAEMIQESNVGIEIDTGALPIFDKALEYAAMGLLPGGLHRNRKYRESMLEVSNEVAQPLRDLVFDPQTSGGLLISLPREQSDELLDRMHRAGIHSAGAIGMVTADLSGKIALR